MADSLSSKIEELQRRWRTEQWENDRPYNPIGAAGVCADELTPLLELAKEMERELELDEKCLANLAEVLRKRGGASE